MAFRRFRRPLRRTRILAPGLLPLRRGMVGMMMLLRRLALGLDAAQGAAQLLNLALVGDLLPLSDFDQFQDFVQLIVKFFQSAGNEGGVGHRFMDGAGLGGPEIRGTDPLAL